jgi:hypothetical protein
VDVDKIVEDVGIVVSRFKKYLEKIIMIIIIEAFHNKKIH